MGNTTAKSGDRSATAAMSKYVHMNKGQLLQMRDFCYVHMTNDTISRDKFHRSMVHARIINDPDWDVLDLLFTMWDASGRDTVACREFIISLSPLVCGDDNLTSFLRFAMLVADDGRTEQIRSRTLVMILQSLNTTASRFGDASLGRRHINKIVDNVFDTLTIMSDEVDDMPHEECLQYLRSEPILMQIVQNKRVNHSVRFVGDKDADSIDRAEQNQSNNINSNNRFYGESSSSPDPVQTSASELSMDVTEVSSVMLTPLAKIPILSAYFSAPRRSSHSVGSGPTISVFSSGSETTTPLRQIGAAPVLIH